MTVSLIRSALSPVATGVRRRRDEAGHSGTESRRSLRARVGALDLVSRVAAGAFAVQLLGMLAWSALLYQRYALTWDYAAYHQVWRELARGQLSPYSSLMDESFWRNDGEFLLWPLSLVGLVFPSGLALLWLQDLALVAANVVCYRWVREALVVELGGSPGLRRALSGLTLLLLIANPWQYWAVSFDWHLEPFATLLAVLAARALYLRRWRPLASYSALLLAAGAPATVVLVGVGIGGLLQPGRRRAGLAMVTAGFAWILGLSALGAAKGAALTTAYGYLAGAHSGQLTTGGLVLAVARHPLNVLRAWWSERLNALSMISGAGLIGAVAAPSVGVVALVLLSADLSGGTARLRIFASTPMQQLPLMPFVAFGTALVLARLFRNRRARPIALALGALSTAYCLLWAAVWLPPLPGTWLRVSPPAAAALARAQQEIPADAEVIAWQGVVGRFSDRPLTYALFQPAEFPVKSPDVYVVAAPYQGIETASVQQSLAIMATMAADPQAHLLFESAGIWVWRLTPPAGLRQVSLTPSSPYVPAWALNAPGGHPVLSGPPATWHLAATGTGGYAASGAYWRVLPGSYQAQAEISTTGPASVEVWDDTSSTLLARRQLPATNGRRFLSMAFTLAALHPPNLFRGWGPATVSPHPRPPGDQIEIRVYTPAGQGVSMYTFGVLPVGAARRAG